MTNNNFKFHVPFDLKKSEETTSGEMRIAGIASTPNSDRQGDSIVQDGMDITEFLNHGFFNYDHDNTKIIGYPDKDKCKFTAEGLYVEGILLKGVPLAEDIYNAAVALQKSGAPRKFGFSVEGQILQRDDKGSILKAKVYHIAVTPMPVNPDCTWETLVKSFAGYSEKVGSPVLKTESLEQDELKEDITGGNDVCSVLNELENCVLNGGSTAVAVDTAKSKLANEKLSKGESLRYLQLVKGLSLADALKVITQGGQQMSKDNLKKSLEELEADSEILSKSMETELDGEKEEEKAEPSEISQGAKDTPEEVEEGKNEPTDAEKSEETAKEDEEEEEEEESEVAKLEKSLMMDILKDPALEKSVNMSTLLKSLVEGIVTAMTVSSMDLQKSIKAQDENSEALIKSLLPLMKSNAALVQMTAKSEELLKSQSSLIEVQSKALVESQELVKSLETKIDKITESLENFSRTSDMRKSVASSFQDKSFADSTGVSAPEKILSKSEISGILLDELKKGNPIVTTMDVMKADAGGELSPQILSLVKSVASR